MTETHVFETIVSEKCCNCGVLFGMEKEYRQRKIDEGGTFYCPNGHKQWYTESTINKLKKQIESKQKQIDYCRNNLRFEKRSHSATKGQLTRKKNKIAELVPAGDSEPKK